MEKKEEAELIKKARENERNKKIFEILENDMEHSKFIAKQNEVEETVHVEKKEEGTYKICRNYGDNVLSDGCNVIEENYDENGNLISINRLRTWDIHYIAGVEIIPFDNGDIQIQKYSNDQSFRTEEGESIVYDTNWKKRNHQEWYEAQELGGFTYTDNSYREYDKDGKMILESKISGDHTDVYDYDIDDISHWDFKGTSIDFYNPETGEKEDIRRYSDLSEEQKKLIISSLYFFLFRGHWYGREQEEQNIADVMEMYAKATKGKRFNMSELINVEFALKGNLENLEKAISGLSEEQVRLAENEHNYGDKESEDKKICDNIRIMKEIQKVRQAEEIKRQQKEITAGMPKITFGDIVKAKEKSEKKQEDPDEPEM